MTTVVFVIFVILASAFVALGMWEVVSFRRWLRRLRQAQTEYLERNHRRRPVRA